EENDEPPQNQHQRQQASVKLKESANSANKSLPEVGRFHNRLQRLLQYREQKHRLQQNNKSKAKAPFVPFVPKNVVEQKQEPHPVNNVRTKKPLCVIPDQKTQKTTPNSKTPVSSLKYIKPRVDCWRTEKIVARATVNVAPKKPSSEKKYYPIKPEVKGLKSENKRTKETQKPIKTARQVVTTQRIRPQSQQKKSEFIFQVEPPPTDGTKHVGTSAIVTSTVRKHCKPLAFSFAPVSNIKKEKDLLNVIKREDLFDGISPIEVDSPAAKGLTHSSPRALKAEFKADGDSIWDPQPVACLSTYEVPAIHDTVKSIVVDSSVIGTNGRKEQRIDCNISDWIPAVAHEIDDDDEVFQDAEASTPTQHEERKRRPALNESFTISPDTVPSNGRLSIVSHVPTQHPPLQVVKINVNKATSVVSAPVIEDELTQPNEQDHGNSPKESEVHGCKTKKRISWNCIEPPLMSEIEQTIQSIEQSTNSPKDSALDGSKTKKRSSLNFIEETIENEIVLSRSNLSLEEKIQQCSIARDEDVLITTTSNTSIRRVRRSSVRISEPVLDEPENDNPAPPKEVLEKTRFYYDKVDSELGRLQGLCDLYTPFLEDSHELNDHCRGLIIAAQGQTNILINKKLTKFRELIGHYEMKWNDRKVRHDDLDGFWLMLSLDLENINKRFDELRSLKENGWQELAPSPEPQPKAKKLRAGGGIRKREKKQPAVGGTKASSSVIAELIRKARQEKLKQKTTVEDLESLKETVTVITTPIKRSVRFGKSPRRSNGQQQRSSLCPGDTPTVFHWEHQEPKQAEQPKRRTIFPDHKTEEVKSILKTPKVKKDRRAKSVLFLDAGLDTPQTRRRHTSRSIVDTPKPKIKFNDELEIEHIDNLAARTPSRLDIEIQKRLQQSQLLFDSTGPVLSNENNDDDSEDTSDGRKKQGRKVYARGTPRRSAGNAASQRRSSRRSSSRVISDLFDEEPNDNKDWYNGLDGESGSAKRFTRSSTNARKKILN
uniref:Guanylate kinase-associated protein mars n=1 Tax=Anopheles christyi TaxID=43041 RepID=A0A182JQZ1_9DIPT